MTMDTVPFKFPDESEDVMKDIESKEDESSDEVVIEVVDDSTEDERKHPVAKAEAPLDDDITDADLKNYSEKSKDKIKKRFQQFTRGYHDARREKEAADRERDEAIRIAQALVDETNNLKDRLNKSQAILADQAKKSAAAAVEQAKATFKRAYESGDSDALTTAQEQLTAAKLRADKVANTRLPTLQPTVPPVLSVPTPPAPRVDPKAAEWQKSNDWFGPDTEMTNVALSVHTTLVGQGVDPSSDAYYDELNSRMRRFFPDKFKGDVESDGRGKNKASIVAGVSRSVAQRKITLTNRQVALAKKLGVPLDVYAKQVAKEMRK